MTKPRGDSWLCRVDFQDQGASSGLALNDSDTVVPAAVVPNRSVLPVSSSISSKVGGHTTALPSSGRLSVSVHVCLFLSNSLTVLLKGQAAQAEARRLTTHTP